MYMTEFQKEAEELKSIIEEPVELEYYGIRHCAPQFCVRMISGKLLSEEDVLLVSLDKGKPEINVQYYGKLEVFYCKKETGVFGREKLKVKKSYQKIYTDKQWKENKEKISMNQMLS